MTLINVLATPLCFVPNLLEGEDNYDVLFRLVTSYTAIHGVPLQYYTIMDFSAGVHNVICTRKINIDRGSSFQKSLNFRF